MIESKEWRGILYGAFASLSISVSSLFVKLCDSIPTNELVFFRFFIGFLFLAPWLLRHPVAFSLKKIPIHLIRDLGGLGAVICFFFSIKAIPLIDATTLRNTSPFFISLILFIWLKQRISKRRLLAIAIGFIGVLLILRPTGGFVLVASLVGIAGAFLSALGLVAVKRLSGEESTYSILFTYFAFSTLVMIIPAIATWQPMEMPILWLYLICIGAFESLFQYFLTLAFTHAHAANASLTIYLMVVFNGLFGWWIWGEVPGVAAAIGIGLIVLGGALATLDKTVPQTLK